VVDASVQVEERYVLYGVIRGILVPVARLVYRPRVEGAENVPEDGRVIIASNHLSFADSLVIPLLMPRKVHFLAKAEYFESKGIKGRISKRFFTAIGAIPVRRGDHRAAKESLETAMKVLSDEDAFAIYPEGTRSLDGRLYRGRTGVGWLALTADAPVVPVGLIGTERLQPVGKKLPRIRRVTIRFGEPVSFPELAGEARSAKARREVTDEIMVRIRELSEQDYAEIYNDHGTAA
jgi:1-acyl-sn-glycerol-3-phosphate acyltransferase